MIAATISTVGYYVLAIVVGIATNMLTPFVAERFFASRKQEGRDVAAIVRPGIVVSGEVAEALVVSVGMNLVRFFGGATLVVIGAVFALTGILFVVLHVNPGLPVRGLDGDFIGGIAQGAGFIVVSAGSYLTSKGAGDMLRLEREYRSKAPAKPAS